MNPKNFNWNHHVKSRKIYIHNSIGYFFCTQPVYLFQQFFCWNLQMNLRFRYQHSSSFNSLTKIEYFLSVFNGICFSHFKTSEDQKNLATRQTNIKHRKHSYVFFRVQIVGTKWQQTRLLHADFPHIPHKEFYIL